MSLANDLEEVKEKVESVLEGVKSAEPTLAEELFKVVEEFFLGKGYTAPTTSEAPAEPETPVDPNATQAQ
jgi:glucosamine 6-phosphate synthetase-like amidotransferase/phosphosugar isomerase protein